MAIVFSKFIFITLYPAGSAISVAAFPIVTHSPARSNRRLVLTGAAACCAGSAMQVNSPMPIMAVSTSISSVERKVLTVISTPAATGTEDGHDKQRPQHRVPLPHHRYQRKGDQRDHRYQRIGTNDEALAIVSVRPSPRLQRKLGQVGADGEGSHPDAAGGLQGDVPDDSHLHQGRAKQRNGLTDQKKQSGFFQDACSSLCFTSPLSV